MNLRLSFSLRALHFTKGCFFLEKEFFSVQNKIPTANKKLRELLNKVIKKLTDKRFNYIPICSRFRVMAEDSYSDSMTEQQDLRADSRLT